MQETQIQHTHTHTHTHTIHRSKNATDSNTTHRSENATDSIQHTIQHRNKNATDSNTTHNTQKQKCNRLEYVQHTEVKMQPTRLQHTKHRSKNATDSNRKWKKNAKNKTKYQCKLKAPLTIQDIKQSPNTSTIPKHTHHSPHDRPLTPQHQEFKILVTPGVLNLTQYWLR